MPRLNYKKLAPRPFEALSSLGHYVHTETTLGHPLLGLVYLRASIKNNCAFCIGMHTAELLHHHEPETRIDAVRDWRASDAFTLRERAALAWTDVITNIQQTHASDADYAAVNKFFSGKDLVDLTWAIASINAWNRVGIAFSSEWAPHEQAKPELKMTEATGDDGGKVAEE
jgi:AhpD family alkylhydroperoxidase